MLYMICFSVYILLELFSVYILLELRIAVRCTHLYFLLV